MSTLQIVRLKAPAKINLFLHVIEKLPTGFHRLQSLFAFLSAADEIEIENHPHDVFIIEGPFAKGLEISESNSVLKAVNWFFSYFEKPRTPHKITLQKNLPVASGIGGGTADAAATIAALIKWHKMTLTPLQVTEIIKSSGCLGADVPVSLAHQLGHGHFFYLDGSGKTELPRAIKMPHIDLEVLLVNPLLPVSTQAAFQGLKHFDAQGPFHECFESQESFLTQMQSYHNTFTPVATQLVPEIDAILQFMSGLDGVHLSRLTGTGATCFGLCDADKIRVAKATLTKNFPHMWIDQAVFA